MLILPLLLSLLSASAVQQDPRPNILYIISDDLRAELGAYGAPTLTPHLDALASRGLLFRNAFCQISGCSPSRHSFLSGRRPDRDGVWNFIDASPLNASAIPSHFRNNGYLTLGLGKTFHEDGGAWNAAAMWSPDRPYYPYTSNACPHGDEAGGHCTLPDSQIYDFHLLNASLDYLSYAMAQRAATGAPFFLMTGFRDPHAPWAAPQRMYDLYNESSLAVAAHPTLGQDSPLIAWSQQLNVRLANGTQYPYGPYSPVPDWVARDQRHAYYAAVSYVDEHVGALLAALDAGGAAENTIIIFQADHGYALGEHGEWEKKSNFDHVVRVPLIISAPGRATGAVTATLLDLVDVFPTLSALAGLPPPPDAAQLDGADLSALFQDPTLTLKSEAFHQYPACGMSAFNQTRLSCNSVPRSQFNYMGYSLRNSQWRYTAWLEWDGVALAGKWQGPYVEELYAHAGDVGASFDAFENVNLAAQLPGIASALRARLQQFFERH